MKIFHFLCHSSSHYVLTYITRREKSRRHFKDSKIFKEQLLERFEKPQLNLVHIPDAEYTRLPPLKLPSELSTTSSKLYPPLKSLRKPSTSLTNLLDNTSEYTPSQDTTSSFLYHNIDIILEISLHADLVQILPHLIYPLFPAILLYDS